MIKTGMRHQVGAHQIGVTVGTEPVAELDILVVQEKSIVETADAAVDIGPDGKARRCREADAPRSLRTTFHEFPDQPAAPPVLESMRFQQFPPQSHGEIPADLFGTILVAQLRPDGAGFLDAQLFLKAWQDVLGKSQVRVRKEEVLAGGDFRELVAGLRIQDWEVG